MDDETKKRISEMVILIGALGEILGETRRSFERNGFTRDESVDLCAELMRMFVMRMMWGD